MRGNDYSSSMGCGSAAAATPAANAWQRDGTNANRWRWKETRRQHGMHEIDRTRACPASALLRNSARRARSARERQGDAASFVRGALAVERAAAAASYEGAAVEGHTHARVSSLWRGGRKSGSSFFVFCFRRSAGGSDSAPSVHQRMIDDQMCPLPSRSKESTALALDATATAKLPRVPPQPCCAVPASRLTRSLDAVRFQPFAFTPLLPCINSTGWSDWRACACSLPVDGCGCLCLGRPCRIPSDCVALLHLTWNRSARGGYARRDAARWLHSLHC